MEGLLFRHLHPTFGATWATSLSPRPERFTFMKRSLDIFCLSRFRNTQVAADFAGEELVDFGVSWNC
jgi:hypothetical protein